MDDDGELKGIKRGEKPGRSQKKNQEATKGKREKDTLTPKAS